MDDERETRANDRFDRPLSMTAQSTGLFVGLLRFGNSRGRGPPGSWTTHPIFVESLERRHEEEEEEDWGMARGETPTVISLAK